jgi:hypothetical protein
LIGAWSKRPEYRALSTPPGRLAHPPRAELGDRLLLVDGLWVVADEGQVMGGVAAPEARMAAPPAAGVAGAQAQQRGEELLVEQQKGEQLAAGARSSPRNSART